MARITTITNAIAYFQDLAGPFYAVTETDIREAMTTFNYTYSQIPTYTNNNNDSDADAFFECVIHAIENREESERYS